MLASHVPLPRESVWEGKPLNFQAAYYLLSICTRLYSTFYLHRVSSSESSEWLECSFLMSFLGKAMHMNITFSIPGTCWKFTKLPSVQSLSCVWFFATPWIAALQASLSITNSQSLLTLMSIESVMPSSHLILCHPLLLLPPIRPSIRVFSNESTLRMRWPKYWSFSFSISPSNEHPVLIVI